MFGRGEGQDTVFENDATTGVLDIVRFGPDVAADQLWFRKSGSNLEVSIVGSADRIVISGWYLSEDRRLEVFETSDGQRLLAGDVQGLVDAMAAYAPPPLGQVTLTGNYSGLLPTIDAAWL